MKNLSKVIKLFNENPKWIIDNKSADFEKKPPIELYSPKVQYEKLWEHYGLNPINFTEKVANLTNPDALYSDKNSALKINWIASPDVMASRADFFDENPFFQLAAIGITRTKDGKIIIGKRGGEITPERVDRFASGLYATPPGGSVSFKEEYEKDPIRDIIESEFYEELGNFDIGNTQLIGVFEAYKPGPIGIKFLGIVDTDATLQQIQQMNMQANELYNSLKSKGASKQDIIKEMEEKGFPIDAWEHYGIRGLENKVDYIEKFLIDEIKNLCGIGEGAIKTYVEFLKKN